MPSENTVHIAIELSVSSWLVAARLPGAEKARLQRVEGGDTAAWLGYQPGSALATWFRERVGTRQRRTRRIAIVAMARRLLIALWRYVETGVLPDSVAIGTAATA